MVALPAIVDGVPLGSDGKPLRPHFEWDESERCPIGRDPRRMSIAELNAIGVYARPVLKAIRANCVDCMGGNEVEVRRCGRVACPMWGIPDGHEPVSGSSKRRAATGSRSTSA